MEKKKILIIEDEKYLLQAIKSKLELEGYAAVSAEDGELGEKMIAEEKPDLVLLDILLPKRNGFDILKNLQKKGDKTPIIIISNSGQPVEIDKVLEMGVVDYLVKANFSPEEVIQKVEKVIGPGVKEKKEEEIKKRSNAKNNEAVFSKAGVSVLIVEDDEFLRKVISHKLASEGFKVFEAIDAQIALQLIKKERPHLILLDLILPGIDGFGFLEMIKKDPNLGDIPVIVLSNLGQKEDQDRAMAAGAVDYLIKANFTPAEIVQKVRDAVRKNYL